MLTPAIPDYSASGKFAGNRTTRAAVALKPRIHVRHEKRRERDHASLFLHAKLSGARVARVARSVSQLQRIGESKHTRAPLLEVPLLLQGKSSIVSTQL